MLEENIQIIAELSKEIEINDLRITFLFQKIQMAINSLDGVSSRYLAKTYQELKVVMLKANPMASKI